MVNVSINNENENEQYSNKNSNNDDNNNQNTSQIYSSTQENSFNSQNTNDNESNNNQTVFVNNSFNNKLKNNRQQKFEGKKNFNKTSTLLIKKIPVHLNRIELLNDHFKKFGSIVNIKVGGADDLNQECALIKYQTPFEANRAYRSTEPVLNNRFIKVFWANQEQLSNTDNKTANTNQNTNSGITNNDNTNTNIENTKRKMDDSKVYLPINSQKKPRATNSGNANQAQTPGNSQIQSPIERKRNMMMLRELQSKYDEFNNKLKELLLNQRLLVGKFAKCPDERKPSVKKLICSNMTSINEIKQKLLDLQNQQLLQKNKLTQTSKIYGNFKKMNNIQKTSDNTATTASTDDQNENEEKNIDNVDDDVSYQQESLIYEEQEPEINNVEEEKDDLEPEEENKNDDDFKNEFGDDDVDYE